MVHEWALAQAIVDSVQSYALSKRASRVKRVVVKIGELQAVDREILTFALSELTKQLDVVSAEKIELGSEDAVLRCRVCGHRWRLRDCPLSEDVAEAVHFIPEAVHAFIKCPNCWSRDFDIVKGRGVYIEGIEVE